MTNALNWFEIPAADIDRAIAFYNAILEANMQRMEFNPGFPMTVLPTEGGIGGAITQGEGYVPSSEGTVVYLNGGDDLQVILDRVEAAGGQILMPKTSLGGNGYAAYILDSEGNRVGLQSPH